MALRGEGSRGLLGWPVKRVNNKINDLPHHRNGGRLIFNTAELDRVVRDGV